MEIKQWRYALRKTATTTGVEKDYGNRGKETRIKEDNPTMPPIRNHFSELLNLREVRATRFVRKITAVKVIMVP